MQAAMADFRSGKAPVLVATDVAGRGLHVSALPLVVNYDFPSNLDTYPPPALSFPAQRHTRCP